MNTGTGFKKIKRRFKKKLYHFLVKLNDFNFGRLRPVCYVLLILSILLAWSKLPTKESVGIASRLTVSASELSADIRSVVSMQTNSPVDVVALFLPQDASEDTLASALSKETLYSFYLTGKELSHLAEGAITTASKENSLHLEGLNFTYHKNRLPFNRVTALSTLNGTEINNTKLYHVVSTEDIFALFHYISYRSIGIMNICPKNAAGTLLSDYKEVVLTETGTPFTIQTALVSCEVSPVAEETAHSVVTMQSGFNLIELVKKPNTITICAAVLFFTFFALLWYIIPRMKRIRLWFRIYLIRRRKRSTHTLRYGLRKRF